MPKMILSLCRTVRQYCTQWLCPPTQPGSSPPNTKLHLKQKRASSVEMSGPSASTVTGYRVIARTFYTFKWKKVHEDRVKSVTKNRPVDFSLSLLVPRCAGLEWGWTVAPDCVTGVQTDIRWCSIAVAIYSEYK